MTWVELLKDRRASFVALLTIAAFIATLVSYTKFLSWVELRPGFAFADPLLNMWGPYDLTWPIFLVLYVALILAILIMGRKPDLLFGILRAYTILAALRMICMAMLPLDAPPAMIPLSDPIVQIATGSGTHPLTKDLFFSGHTSVMLLVAFALPNKWMKAVYYLLAAFIGIAVILQHVHYTVDVLVAPMAAWLASSVAGTPQNARAYASK